MSLRHRKGHDTPAYTQDENQETVEEIPATIPNDSTAKRSTIGRTPDGNTFVVPQTKDMVTTLFDPRERKSVMDLAIVAVLASYIALYVMTPKHLRVPIFVVLFFGWRVAYNGGIGYLLTIQSKRRQLVKWAKEWAIFEPNSRSFTSRLARMDLSAKLDPEQYSFDTAPLEFNTWMVFRNLVDLILMSDFTCYMLLVLACYSPHPDHSLWLVASRWTAGTVLILFNLWVKLDAHRVVKDYAWFWGDFFFLEDVQLTFDGVFEMAPHPMYSIGYAGYYGFCLMTGSYTLFAVSVIAHACQFAFLILVENPHIDKTYNPVVRRRRVTNDMEQDSELNSSDSSNPPLLVFSNFNFTRSSDLLVLSLTVYSSLTYFCPRNTSWYIVTLVSALGWRVFHNLGLGLLLKSQSNHMTWTKLFLKHGLSAADAYSQWQVLYNLSTVMSYTSFGVFALREWHSPVYVPMWPFRYIVGVMLMALQAWTSYSVYESLGYFGWFFGDFFLSRNHQLTYSGIYRYLNNPERLFGIAGVWGAALLTNSLAVAALAFVWTVGGMAFIQFVEQPHMKKLYGSQLRDEAGLTKTLSRQAAKLPPPLTSQVKRLQGSIDQVISEAAQAVETFLTGPVNHVVNDTKVLLKQYPARLTLVRVSEDVIVDTSGYTLEIKGASLVESEVSPALSSTRFLYGQPITVTWTAGKNRSTRDWIGLYSLAAKNDRNVTRVRSRGRWSAVCKNPKSDPDFVDEHMHAIVRDDVTSGDVVFSGRLLFWEPGAYEFRYHYDGNHNVLAISDPFEIVMPKISIGKDPEALATTLLPHIQRCYQDTGVPPPDTVQADWDFEDDKNVIQRVAYLVRWACGVDLAPAVLKADLNVMALSKRLIDVNAALEPFVR